MKRNKRNIKSYIEWISDTYNNLLPYDSTFDYGNKYLDEHEMGRLVRNDVNNYAVSFITKLLIIYVYEFLNLFYCWKFEKREKYILNFTQFVSKMKQKFSISCCLKENKDVINKILKSDIFKNTKKTINIKRTVANYSISYYEILHKARQEIAHADLNHDSTGWINAVNYFPNILHILLDTTKVK